MRGFRPGYYYDDGGLLDRFIFPIEPTCDHGQRWRDGCLECGTAPKPEDAERGDT